MTIKKRFRIADIRIVGMLFVLLAVGCGSPDRNAVEEKRTKFKTERVVVDDSVIDAGDYFKVIEPVWWEGNIYGTHEEYKKSLGKYSVPQRFVFAIAWYESEVNNGGHEQFYSNSTGIVWKDALEGFKVIGAKQRYDILKESADRLGGNPSFDRKARSNQLERNQKGFEDLDSSFYELKDDFGEKMDQYIKSNRKSFYFDGVIRKPVL